jgi:hypothetical protein
MSCPDPNFLIKSQSPPGPAASRTEKRLSEKTGRKYPDLDQTPTRAQFLDFPWIYCILSLGVILGRNWIFNQLCDKYGPFFIKLV